MKTARIAFLLLLASTQVFARHPKVARDLEGADPSTYIDVIVQFRETPTEAQHQKVYNQGGKYKATLDVIHAGVYSMPAGRLEELANDPDVSYISPDRGVKAASTNLTPDYKLQAVEADIAQSAGWNGTGIGVAVIDSGITDEPDLHGPNGSRIVYAQSLIGNASANDLFGHGTHVAGIVAGTGGLSQGVYAGVATNANLINLQVLNQNGQGNDSGVIAALQAAIQLKWQYNIRVINLSLGRPVYESYTVDPLCQAVEAAWHAGMVVVVAAGNQGRNNSENTSGYATIQAPGNDPYAITVGATKNEWNAGQLSELIASYSSKGPTLFDHVVKPDLVAPGNKIVSVLACGTLCQEYPANIVDGAYFTLSGTSMATAVVSGGAALLLQQNPGLTPDQVKARLMKTASKIFPQYSTTLVAASATAASLGSSTALVSYTSQYDIFTIGAGLLDVWAALNNTDVLPAGETAESPAVQYDAATGTVSLVTGSSLVWGDAPLWSTNLVWGSSVLLNASNILWGDSLVWGDSAVTGFSLVWGDYVIWGDSTQEATESTLLTINGEN